ncbi:hypothetical protein FGRMN_321 [Fusarium graminum]|nr:hypothetical protein FGRMN_321 [Fusarium graminum]
MDLALDWEGDTIMTDAPPISPQGEQAKETQEKSDQMAKESPFAPQTLYCSVQNGNGQLGTMRGSVPYTRRRLAMAVGPNRSEAIRATIQQTGNRRSPRRMENVALSLQNEGTSTDKTPGQSMQESQTCGRNKELSNCFQQER